MNEKVKPPESPEPSDPFWARGFLKNQEDFLNERNSKEGQKEKEAETQETQPLSMVDFIKMIQGISKIKETLKTPSKDSKEKKEADAEKAKDLQRLELLIQILTEEIENESDVTEKASLKKRLSNNLEFYFSLREERNKNEDALRPKIDWSKVSSVFKTALEEFGPIAMKTFFYYLNKK